MPSSVRAMLLMTTMLACYYQMIQTLNEPRPLLGAQAKRLPPPPRVLGKESSLKPQPKRTAKRGNR